jgi:hypothetical protein
MEQLYRYALYFVLSGGITVAVSYLNESGKGGMAAMVASIPIFFILTAMVAYYTAGPSVAVDFSRSMVIANIGWLASVVVFGAAVHQGYHPAVAVTGTVVTYLALTAVISSMGV